MTQILIRNGRVIDPANHRDGIMDVLVENGVISRVDKMSPTDGMTVIDATEKWVVPGIVDMHVHLRDLNESHKETIETGTHAALRGGVTTVMAMPNTKPPLERAERIREYQELIRKNAQVHVLIAGGMTRDLGNEGLAELDAYRALGIQAISNDGLDVANDELLEAVFKKAKALDMLIFAHAEMMKMAMGAPVNEGPVSEELGVLGVPKAKEIEAVQRLLRLTKKIGTRLHITHVSCRESVELVRCAKREGLPVTCDATPHHFSLTEKEVLEFGSQAKVNPPLRSEDDRKALIEGIKDDTIDAIVTDHAPHQTTCKTDDLINSCFGFSGVEILVPATLTELYFREQIALNKIFAKITFVPGVILKQSVGTLLEGAQADLTIIDPNAEHIVDPSRFLSLGHNTPFAGKKLKGWPVRTMIRGVAHCNDYND